MNPFFNKNAVVLFQGDSITDAWRTMEGGHPLGEGYPRLIADMYGRLFPEQGVQFVNRGVSGNRSCDLLARYEQDFVQVKPDFISILIGINDVWRRYDSNDPTSTEQYESNCRTLLQNLRRDLPQAKILLIEPFVLESLPDRAQWREDLDPKIAALRRLAVQYADWYLPADGMMAALCCERHTPAELADDGVHPTPLGHAYLAESWLKKLGIL